MSDLKINRRNKIPQSVFAKNFLNHWAAEFSKTDRVTAAELESDLDLFSTMLEASFQTDTSLNQAAELLLKLFSLSHKTHQTDRWLNLVPLVLSKANSDKIDVSLKVRLLNRMGQTCLLQNQTDQAYSFYKQALTFCDEGHCQDAFCQADCYLHLAEFCHKTQAHETALDYSSALLNLPSFRSFPASFRATAQNLNGLILVALDQISEAFKPFQSAADIWQTEGDEVEQIRSLLNIGFTWLKIGRNDMARQTFEQTLQLAEKYPNKKIVVLNNMGILNFNDDKLQQAIRNWQEGVRTAAALPTAPRVLGEILHNLGFVHQRLRLFEPAATYFDRASLAWRKQNNTFEVARAIGGKAETFSDWGKYQESIALFDKAITVLGEIAADNWLLLELHAGRKAAHEKLKQ